MSQNQSSGKDEQHRGRRLLQNPRLRRRRTRTNGQTARQAPGRGKMKLLLATVLVATSLFAQATPRVFVVNKAGDSVAVVDAASLRVLHTIPVGRNPHELAVAPDGLKLYVPNVADNSISVVDLRTNSETKKITHPNLNSPHGVAFTPDSRRALVTSERSRKI